jgi:hypothetical protein
VIVCVPTVSAQPVINIAKCLKLGALKQSLNRILSISKACGKFLLAIGVPLPMFFFQKRVWQERRLFSSDSSTISNY